MISARALHGRVAAGALTPAAALDLQLAAIAEHEPRIEAFVRTDPPGARRTAESATGPLAGIGVAVKDIIDTADMPTEMGSPIWADWRPRAEVLLDGVPSAACGRSEAQAMDPPGKRRGSWASKLLRVCRRARAIRHPRQGG